MKDGDSGREVLERKEERGGGVKLDIIDRDDLAGLSGCRQDGN